MPSVYHSPSLQKMEGTGLRRRKRFSCGNIIGDPFALATISIAFLGWILALVASIIAALDAPFPKYNWWTLAFMFFVIIGVTIVEGADSTRTYNVAIVGYLSAGIVMTSSAVQTTIYSGVAASEAAAAGFILLAVVCIIWVFYFGSQPQSTHRSYVDSFALQKEGRPSVRSSARQMSTRYTDQHGSAMPNVPPMYASTQLNGFETSAPSGYLGDPRGSQMPRFGGAASPGSPGPGAGPGAGAFQVRQSGLGYGSATGPRGSSNAEDLLSSGPPPDAYKYRARAIYTYDANPEDANEISFDKGEVLDVSDVSGKWWQAKKADGQTGIAPSNYLILL